MYAVPFVLCEAIFATFSSLTAKLNPSVFPLEFASVTESLLSPPSVRSEKTFGAEIWIMEGASASVFEDEVPEFPFASSIAFFPT